MIKSLNNFLIAAFALILCLNCNSQKGQNITKNNEPLKQLIENWLSSGLNGDTTSFEKLLSEDYQLMAWGKRYNKKEVVEMIKDFSDGSYSMDNIRSGSGGNIGFITFDIKDSCVGFPFLELR